MSPAMLSTAPAQDLRRRIRDELPAETFSPRPRRALWFVPLAGTVAVSMWLLIGARPAWYLSLPLAVLIGECFAAMGFLAHEALHGSMVSSTRLQTFLGYLGFGPVGVSPALWRVWHNQVHHAKTNKGNSDPDSFGTLERYKKAPSTRFVARLAPGSRHWTSAFFFAYWFTFHSQVVLWIQSKYMRSFSNLNRRRAKLDTLGAVVCWTALGLVAGWQSLYVIIIPIVVANATVMSYIATNHFMRPQTETNEPLENSMSVTTLPLIDKVHFNFSHHVEHHLFPRMSARSAPVVRAWLRENTPDRYVSPPHHTALTSLYRTPRVYLDATTLCDPEDLDHHVSTQDIETTFRAA